MRNLLLALIVAASAMNTMSVTAADIPPPPTPNAINVARYFANAEQVHHYEGWANFFISGTQYVANFNFTSNVGITTMQIQVGEVWYSILTESDPPLAGFPSGLLGEIENFGLGMAAYSANREYLGYGQSVSDHYGLLPGEPIRVVMQPGWVERVFAFDPAASGLDPNDLAFITANGAYYRYDASIGGFRIWVDPTMITPYTIVVGSTGDKVVTGEFDPYAGDPPAAPNISLINFGYEGDVEKLDHTQDITLGNQQPVTMEIPGRGVSLPAKVYFTDRLDEALYFVSAYSPNKGDVPPDNYEVIVYRATNIGDLPVVAEGQSWSGDIRERGAIIVVVISRDGSPFQIYAGPGGGKG